MDVLSALDPNSVFSYFEKLCAVPHGSGNTKAISDLCVSWAKELGLKYRQDECNNVVIWSPGTKGYENSAPVMLQGHLDMVCAKAPGCTKNMEKEGLDLVTDGEWVWADKTSLGGDDGIAIAIAFAILADSSLSHPPIEAVFTVGEETGMYGAYGLDCSDLRSRMLINLDSEEDGIFTVSCSGGAKLDCDLPFPAEPVWDSIGMRITVSGLTGGHSGTEIDKGRANAICVMARLLAKLSESTSLRLCAFEGGEFDNVICPNCLAEIAIPASKKGFVQAQIPKFEQVLRAEYYGCDGGISVSAEEIPVRSAISKENSRRALAVLNNIPQGVYAFSAAFPGRVQTSLNIGIIRQTADGLRFTAFGRSSLSSQRDYLIEKVQALIALAGGKSEIRGTYHPWPYAEKSPLRDTLAEAFCEVVGHEPKIDITHGGLECGILISKIPGLNAVSLGPDIPNIHSPRERMQVATVMRLYKVVCRALELLK